MRAAVVDASVAAKGVAQEELTEQANALLAGVALCAPAHWQAEAVNVLWGGSIVGNGMPGQPVSEPRP